MQRALRITRYEVSRHASGARVAAYTVRLVRRDFVLVRRLGSPRMRIVRPADGSQADGPER